MSAYTDWRDAVQAIVDNDTLIENARLAHVALEEDERAKRQIIFDIAAAGPFAGKPAGTFTYIVSGTDKYSIDWNGTEIIRAVLLTEEL